MVKLQRLMWRREVKVIVISGKVKNNHFENRQSTQLVQYQFPNARRPLSGLGRGSINSGIGSSFSMHRQSTRTEVAIQDI